MDQQRLCLACSKPFEVPASSKRQYCSVACHPRQDHSRRKRSSVTVECAHCGKGFERKAWIAEKQERLGQQQYCSVECRKGAFRGRKGEQRVERITIQCAGCGKTFEVPPYQRHRKTCSHQCAGRMGGRPGSRQTRLITTEGYVEIYLPSGERPPGQEKKSHHREHRVVMAQMLGRWPEPHETVHHINGDKADNRPENLQLRNGRHGKGGVLRCRACGSSDIEHVEV